MAMLCEFNTRAGAQAFVNAVDAVLGYPKDAEDGGGGVHCTKLQSRTLTWCDPIQKFGDSTKWGIVFKPRLNLLTTAAAENKIVNGVDNVSGTTSVLVAFSLTQTQYDSLKAKLLTATDVGKTWDPP